MKRSGTILALILWASTSFGYFDGLEDFGIFDGSMAGRSSLYPPQADLAQWLYDSNETQAVAKVGSDADIVGVNCLISTGAQTISHASIANGATIVNAGTATGTATAGVITFTAGTISQVQIDGVMTYICEEELGFPYDVSTNGNHITSMTATWTNDTTGSLSSYNLGSGCSKVNGAFETEWTTTGTPQNITVPTTGTGYDGRIKWFNSAGTLLSSLPFDDGDMSAMTIALPTAGDYTCKITGAFPRIYFNSGGDKLYINEITNKGYLGWTNFKRSYKGCGNITNIDLGDVDSSGVSDWDEICNGAVALKTFHVLSANISLLDTAASAFLSVTLNTLGAGGLDEMITHFASEHRAGRALDNVPVHLGSGTHSAASDDDFIYLSTSTGSGGAGWTITGGVLAP